MFRAPRQLPSFESMLRDIGQPTPAVLGRHLGVHERTVYTWQAKGEAPRPVMLALFYESRWGRSLIATEAENAARWARGHVEALQREVSTLHARIAYLEAVGSYGAANEPTLQPSVSRIGPYGRV